MPYQLKNISDRDMLLFLEDNNTVVWDKIYDKYAPAMYSVVTKLTDDSEIADKIFMDAFIQFKETHNVVKTTHSFCTQLLRYTYHYAIRYLTAVGINPKQSDPMLMATLIHLLCTQCSSLTEAASVLNITEEDARLKLRNELLEMRQQNKEAAYQTHQQEVFYEKQPFNNN